TSSATWNWAPEPRDRNGSWIAGQQRVISQSSQKNLGGTHLPSSIPNLARGLARNYSVQGGSIAGRPRKRLLQRMPRVSSRLLPCLISSSMSENRGRSSNGQDSGWIPKGFCCSPHHVRAVCLAASWARNGL